jgi:hypothetical protein
MRWFVHRLIGVVAIVFACMTAALVTPAVSSADCTNTSNMSRNPTTRECQLPPAPPDWYAAPPAYAPSFAAQDVPPPPPPPPWWAGWQVPMWSVGFHQWGYYVGPAWIPL